MTACFQPKLFLNSLKQFAARQLSVTVDQLTIAYIWNDGYSGTKRRTSLIPAAATATSSSDYGIMDESMIRAKVQPYSSAKIVYGIITGIGLEGMAFNPQFSDFRIEDSLHLDVHCNYWTHSMTSCHTYSPFTLHLLFCLYSLSPSVFPFFSISYGFKSFVTNASFRRAYSIVVTWRQYTTTRDPGRK